MFYSAFDLTPPPAANHSPEERELQPEVTHLLHGGSDAAEM